MVESSFTETLTALPATTEVSVGVPSLSVIANETAAIELAAGRSPNAAKATIMVRLNVNISHILLRYRHCEQSPA